MRTRKQKMEHDMQQDNRTRLPDNEEALELRDKQDPTLLFERFLACWQLLLQITYRHMGRKGSPEDVEDCLSSFLEEKLGIVVNSFDPTVSSFSSYFNSSLRNYCSGMARRLDKRAKTEISMTGLEDSGSPLLGFAPDRFVGSADRAPAFRSVKGPAKPGSVSSAAVARAVRSVAKRRARQADSATPGHHKSK
jgi:hypothetical protein